MERDTATLRRFLREREYLKIMFADVVSRFGDSLDSIAYGWMVYQLTGSKSWLAVIFGVNALPTILFQPLGGALVEFFDKKKTVVACDAGRGLIVTVTGILMITGILKPWHIMALTFLNSTLEAFRIPSGISIIPHVLSRENYTAGIAYSQSVNRIAELIGLGAAGAVVGLAGTGGALVVDGVTFFLSAAVLSFLKFTDAERHKERISLSGYARDLKQGFQYFRRSGIVFLLCAVCILLNVAELPIDQLQAAYVEEGLRLGVYAMSVGGTAMTLGMICGAVLCPRLPARLTPKLRLIGSGAVIGVFYLLLSCLGFLSPPAARYGAYAVCSFLFGNISAVIDVTLHVLVMNAVSREYMGRIVGIFNAVTASSVPLISGILAVLAAFLSITEIYVVTGIFAAAAFLALLGTKTAAELDRISEKKE